MKKSLLITLIVLFLPITALAESQQTSGVTAGVIIEGARYYVNETTASFWDDSTDMLWYVRAAIADVARNTECLETTEVIALVTGQTEYPLSSNYYHVEKALYSGATVEYNDSRSKGLQRIPLIKVGHTNTIGEPVRYSVWNDILIIDPEPASAVSGYKVSVYEIARPTRITSGNSVIQTPEKYDDILSVYVAGKASIRSGDYNRSAFLMSQYDSFIAIETKKIRLQRDKDEGVE